MRVLVVDDEPQIVQALAMNLRARRYEVHHRRHRRRRAASGRTSSRRTWCCSISGCPTWTGSR